ncbi:hypothetical protein HMI55_001745, partial [Coelomomyces lativittatus]
RTIKEDHQAMLELDQEENDAMNALFNRINGKHDLTYDECLQLALSISTLPSTSSISVTPQITSPYEEDTVLQSTLALSLIEQ